jgi:sugar phosphate isomerase/epimerase
LKLAAYLDEAADDPTSACKVLVGCGISNVVLRRAWTNDICSLADSACAQLRDILAAYKLKPVLLVTNIGYVPANELMGTQPALLERALHLAHYFKISMIRVGFGARTKVNPKSIQSWIDHVTNACFTNNIQPLFEINHNAFHYKAVEVAELLSKNKRIRLLFDPAELITHQHLNPFTKYWSLLKSYVAAIDIRDCKIGVGFKPIGFGDCQFKHLVSDALTSKYAGWWLFEPSLGRRHGSANTRQETFRMAHEALGTFLKWVSDQTSVK